MREHCREGDIYIEWRLGSLNTDLVTYNESSKGLPPKTRQEKQWVSDQNFGPQFESL